MITIVKDMLVGYTPHCAPDSLDGIKIKGTTKSNHMDMITELDVQVKMITDELKRQGIYDNTIIIFTSDNGGLHVDGTNVSIWLIKYSNILFVPEIPPAVKFGRSRIKSGMTALGSRDVVPIHFINFPRTVIIIS